MLWFNDPIRTGRPMSLLGASPGAASAAFTPIFRMSRAGTSIAMLGTPPTDMGNYLAVERNVGGGYSLTFPLPTGLYMAASVRVSVAFEDYENQWYPYITTFRSAGGGIGRTDPPNVAFRMVNGLTAIRTNNELGPAPDYEVRDVIDQTGRTPIPLGEWAVVEYYFFGQEMATRSPYDADWVTRATYEPWAETAQLIVGADNRTFIDDHPSWGGITPFDIGGIAIYDQMPTEARRAEAVAWAAAQIPIQPIVRAAAADWNGSQIVGTGVTLAPETTAPAVSGDALLFDGVADALSGAVDFDLTGKTVIVVAQAAASSAQQQGLWHVSNGSAYAQVEARNNPAGQFQGAHRSHASMGFGATQIVPSTALNVIEDQAGAMQIYCTSYGTDLVRHAVGPRSGQTVTSTGAVRAMTTLCLGRGYSGLFAGHEFYEIAIYDTVDPVVINGEIARLKTLYGATGPTFTSLFRTDMAVMGDSISVGVGATGSGDFVRQMLLPFVTTRTTNGIAGSQISPYGLSDAGQIGAAFSNITAAAAPFTGKGAAMIFAGTNDYGAAHGGTPLGAPSSTDPATFNGALNVGWASYLANSPADQILFIFTPVPRFDQTGENATGATLADYAQAVRDFVARIGSPRLVLVEMMDCGLLVG